MGQFQGAKYECDFNILVVYFQKINLGKLGVSLPHFLHDF